MDKLARLDDQREALERELHAATGRQERIEQLERDKEAVLVHGLSPWRSTLDTLAPEQRHGLYKRYGIRAEIDEHGDTRLTGMAWEEGEGVCSTGTTTRCSLGSMPGGSPARSTASGADLAGLRRHVHGLPQGVGAGPDLAQNRLGEPHAGELGVDEAAVGGEDLAHARHGAFQLLL